ncbi:MAG: thiamine pyrophosphate-dependent enzyme [Nitrososphaerota archaeon]|nr:thiamine pyrophosphate-dependent enzyme [Candidatus Bathyarchaeota archaeon]MDW8022847.1 thiamine pyrophosphate-dependent enzyme [Nitrososphaerota archaeon]
MKIKEEELLMPGHPLCPGCGIAIAVRQVMKVLGKKTIVLLPPSCVGPLTREGAFKFRVPGVHIALDHGAAVAAGVKAGLEVRGMKDVIVVPIVGDGGTADIGLQALSGAAERNDDILYVCTDNEAYMNTGRQGSASTPFGAYTTTTPVGALAPFGRDRPKKDLFRIITDHKVPYAATASPSYPVDLRRKVEKAKQTPGFRYLHILCPCPTGWGYSTEKTVEMGRLAVKTRCFILAESEFGRVRITYNVDEKTPVEQYLKMQGRFRHLKDEQVKMVQAYVDEQWEDYVRAAGGSP